MTSVEVIIGHGDTDDVHRTAARTWVTAWWQTHGYQVRTHRAPSDPWVKADAYNPPAAESDADVLIIADADSFVGVEQVTAAIAGASRVGWSTVASRVHRLSVESTTATLAADPATTDTPPMRDLDPGRPVHDLLAGGGIVTVCADVWRDAGGFDPRFVGWGGEDWSLGAALRTLTGCYAHKVPGPYWHLWHPLAAPVDALEADADALVWRYRKAKFKPDAMRALIAEREAVTCR